MRKYIFISAMIASFVFGLLQAEARRRLYHEDAPDFRAKSLFYAATVPYDVRQILDMHWLALVPLRVLNGLPRSLALDDPGDKGNQFLRTAAATLSVGVFWSLVALWFCRLRSRSLTQAGRIVGMGALAVFSAALAFALWSQLEYAPRNERLSDSAILPAVLLIIMSLAQCGWLSAIIRMRWHYVLIPVLLCGSFLWADYWLRSGFETIDREYRTCLEKYNSRTEHCWDLGYIPPPLIQDTLNLSLVPNVILPLSGNGPVTAVNWVVGRLPGTGTANNSHVRFGVCGLLVAAYWFVILLFASSKSGPVLRIRAMLRPLVLFSAGVVFVGALIWWIALEPHGYEGMFGVMLGAGALWCAFYRKTPKCPV